MKKKKYPVKSSVSVAILAIMSCQLSHAGAFSLYTESSAAAVGNYAAGIAAEAVDASTAWYNPAGLVLLKKPEVLFSGVGVLPSTQLSGVSTFDTIGFDPYRQSFQDLQGAESALVPALHYALPLENGRAFGLSIVAPFGLSTDWGNESPLRYAATRTELQTIDLSADLATKLTNHLSFGAGLDVQWAEVKFNAVLGAPTVLQFAQEEGVLVTPTSYDSTSVNQGRSVGWGFHTGVLGSFNENHTRVGLNYQSKVSHKFTGKSTLTGVLADTLLIDSSAVFSEHELYSNVVELPNIVTLSAYQDVNAKWALLGSLVYSGWSTFNTIELNNIAAYSFAEDNHELVNSIATENYRDAWRAALGANYQVTDKWKVRFGGGYDQTPTVNFARDVRLPDANRWALAIGSHYQFRPNLGLDVGYSYLFAANDSVVNKTQPIGSISSLAINAKGNVHAQLVGAQIVWAMG